MWFCGTIYFHWVVSYRMPSLSLETKISHLHIFKLPYLSGNVSPVIVKFGCRGGYGFEYILNEGGSAKWVCHEYRGEGGVKNGQKCPKGRFRSSLEIDWIFFRHFNFPESAVQGHTKIEITNSRSSILPWSTAVVIATAFNFFEVWGSIPHLPVWANPRQTTADLSAVNQPTALFAPFGDIWLKLLTAKTSSLTLQ